MIEFFNVAFQMPTLIFSVLLILVIAYWVLVLLGAMDMDLLGGGEAEALEGVVEVGSGKQPSIGSSVLDTIGLGGVPLAISLSGVVLIAWFATFVGMTVTAGGGLLLSTSVVAVAMIVAVIVTSLAVRPLEKVFANVPSTRHVDLLGRVGVLTTQRIDASFGQVEITDGDGASLIVQARATATLPLKRGDRAVIYDYDAKRGVFLVRPISPEHSQLLDASASIRKVLDQRSEQ